MLKTIMMFFESIRAFPVWLIIQCGQKKVEIFKELEMWGGYYAKDIIPSRHIALLGYILDKYPEYRNLLIHRIRHDGHSFLGSIVTSFLWPRMKSLLIFTENIGFGLFIQHGIGTVIAAKSIGDNCWINQNVTLGYDFSGEAPVLKNGVRICCGANVIGDVTIGDNAIVGAGSVVLKDIEENKIVAGVPSKVIGDNEEHKLFVG